MKYSVTVDEVSLDEANLILKAVHGMGFGIPEIAESKERKVEQSEIISKPRRRRHGIGVILKNTGMSFISLREAFEWLRSSCNIHGSCNSLKRAIESGKSYNGFDFIFEKRSNVNNVEEA